jgi:hypothetical protein
MGLSPDSSVNLVAAVISLGASLIAYRQASFQKKKADLPYGLLKKPNSAPSL